MNITVNYGYECRRGCRTTLRALSISTRRRPLPLYSHYQCHLGVQRFTFGHFLVAEPRDVKCLKLQVREHYCTYFAAAGWGRVKLVQVYGGNGISRGCWLNDLSCRVLIERAEGDGVSHFFPFPSFAPLVPLLSFSPPASSFTTCRCARVVLASLAYRRRPISMWACKDTFLDLLPAMFPPSKPGQMVFHLFLSFFMYQEVSISV